MTIPDPPRSVRWRAALAWRWPLGFGTAILFCIASAVVGSFWLGSDWDLPFDDYALDSGAETWQAQVVEVSPQPQSTPTRLLYQVRYTFDLGDGRQRFGVCYAASRREFSQGELKDLEYLSGDPNIHRLAGTTRAISTVWMPGLVGSVWLPLLLILLWWFRGAFRLRYVLGNGTAAVAEILSTRNLWFINPSQLSVNYQYPDRYGQLRKGHHWVRRSSAMGKLLVGGQEHMDVIYDELRVNVSRLVDARDFTGSRASA